MKQPKNIPNKEEILTLYSKEGVSISSLARHFGTTNPTIRKWLIFYQIERKSHRQASREANNRNKSRRKPSKEMLKNLYEDSTIKSLEKYFNVGQDTIYEWLKEYDIELKNLSDACKQEKRKKFEDIQFSKEFLDENYDREKSINKLAEKLNVSRSHIRSQLIENGIKIKPIEPSWRSKPEIDLYDYLIKEFPNDNWTHSNKSIINPYELDIVNLDKKLAIEYCGLYWHSEGSSGKKQNYHREKYLKCKENGYKLITVFDSDDIVKVKNLILKLLGKTEKIGARKTIIKRLTSKVAMEFHNNHHLHSSVGGSFHYGLLYENNLLMVISFGKNRFSKNYEYECSRLTSHGNYTVVGGVSKLMKHFIKEVNPNSIITFADLRFGDGNVYTKCGFERVEDSPPNYWYSKKYTPELHSRVKFQKHKLKTQLETFDITKTEFENMFENGWDRIWDCGNGKYVWKNKKGGN